MKQSDFSAEINVSDSPHIGLLGNIASNACFEELTTAPLADGSYFAVHVFSESPDSMVKLSVSLIDSNGFPIAISENYFEIPSQVIFPLISGKTYSLTIQ